MSLTPLDEDSSEVQEPERQGVCDTLRHSANWKCFILTLLILACLAAIAWCRLTQVTKVFLDFDTFPITMTRKLSACEDGYLYIPVAFLAMLYLVYLLECFHCPTRMQLTHTTPASHVEAMIEAMRAAQPVIWWKAMCYHYVRRCRHVTRYRNGDAYTSTQVFYERVNSHSVGTCFLFSNCGAKDISKKLVNLSKYACTKIRISKGFAFANLEAANEFEEQRARFFQESERRDDYMEMREGLDLTNVVFREFVIARRDNRRPPWYVRHVVFWVASLLLLSWPLRFLIEYNTTYVHYQVTKLFGVNYTTPVSGGRASRGSATTDSHDLEVTIANNCTLVPSYSEALLMEVSAPVDANGNIPGSLPAAASSASVGSELAVSLSLGAAASRTSLHNGYVLYHASPLVPCVPADPFEGCGCTLPAEAPPDYDDALRVSAPLLGSMSPSPLRRSHTERDIPSTPRLALPRRSCHYDLETQL
ncbi:transmembrane protein 151B-like [Portunus trituberculatus]|uniref:transmembrane protein 151B-like n=1 Tax=Portunus trituberculatus TaxID=210409 RepID=UPI001E1CF3B0|nr:transmembrane protein 151B-like [Portunus trituberculatus]XP_045136668.1 transmembrane protein 151B-like [Portunus trituberculatus]XP_045136669.1 transmembrane protein 151B-like [Portunus trituberculatus]